MSELQQGPGAEEAGEAADSGEIRCICGIDTDDGFTIQCETCFVWQHALCVNIQPSNVPDIYLCEQCAPRTGLDAALARHRQTLRMEAEEGLRHLQQNHNQHARSSNTAYVLAVEDEDEVKAAARAVALGEQDMSDLPLSSPAAPPSNGTVNPRKRTASIIGAPQLTSSTSHTATQSNKKRRKPPKQLSQSQQQHSLQSPPLLASAADIGRRSTTFQQHQQDDFFATDAGIESWAYEYTPIEAPLWPDPAAVKHLQSALEQWLTSTSVGKDRWHVHPLQPHSELEPFSGPVTWARSKSTSSSSEQEDPTKENLFAAYETETDEGLTAPLGPVHMSTLPTGPHNVVVRIVEAQSQSLVPPLSTPFSTSTSAANSGTPTISCPYPRPIAHALYASANVSAGGFVSSLQGEVVSREAYVSDRSNQYRSLGVPKPGVRGLLLPWSLMLDSRRYGNEARFIRSGCHPNAIVRPIIHNQKRVASSEEQLQVSFGIFALNDIHKRDEIVLPWDWDDHHIVHLLPELLFGNAEDNAGDSAAAADPSSICASLPLLSQRMALVAGTQLALSPCACPKRKNCALAWMHKLACCSQPSAVGGYNRREHLDLELVEDKLRAILFSGGRGGKKGTDLKSVGFRRGWEQEPEAPRQPPQEEQTTDAQPPEQPRADEPAEVDEADKGSDYSGDSDATEPLDPHQLDSPKKRAVDVSADMPSGDAEMEGPTNDTGLQETAQEQAQAQPSAQETSEAQPEVEQERAGAGEHPEATRTDLNRAEFSQVEPAEDALISDAAPSIKPDDKGDAFQDKADDLKGPQAAHDPQEQLHLDEAAANRPDATTAEPAPEPEPEPEPEPAPPKSPSPPPVVKAKMSFAAFQKRRLEKGPEAEEGEAEQAPQPQPSPEASTTAGAGAAADAPAHSKLNESLQESPEKTKPRAEESAFSPLRKHDHHHSEPDEEGPVYRPASPIYRPSSPPPAVSLQRVEGSPSDKSRHVLKKSPSPPVRSSQANTQQAEPAGHSHGRSSSYIPSAPSFQYEPILRSDDMRSPSPATRSPAAPTQPASQRSERPASPVARASGPPLADRWHPQPPTGPRRGSGSMADMGPRRGYRGRGRGQHPSSPPFGYGHHHGPSAPPSGPSRWTAEPPRAPRGFQSSSSAAGGGGGGPGMPHGHPRPSPFAGAPGGRPNPFMDRGPYRGAPRGPRGGGWRNSGRGRG